MVFYFSCWSKYYFFSHNVQEPGGYYTRGKMFTRKEKSPLRAQRHLKSNSSILCRLRRQQEKHKIKKTLCLFHAKLLKLRIFFATFHKWLSNFVLIERAIALLFSTDFQYKIPLWKHSVRQLRQAFNFQK